MQLSDIELHRKYRELELTNSDGFTVVLYIHRRCSCVVDNPDDHEKVCFDPPVQLERTPFSQHHFETLIGGK